MNFLGQINIWPSKKAIDVTLPEDFKQKYSSTRVIIDCTELRCQMPSSLHLNGELLSNYKSHTILNELICISTGRAISFTGLEIKINFKLPKIAQRKNGCQMQKCSRQIVQE